MNLSYSNIPFPHIKGNIDESLYDEFLKEWESVDHTNYKISSGNRSNIPLENLDLFSKLSSVMMQCYDHLAPELLKDYPKLIDKEFNLKPRILFSENAASETQYKIRGWHLDTGDKILIGLWYFKHPEEEDCGGDLLIMNPQTKESTVIKYEPNTFIIFPNLMSSWHAVTPRKPSKYPRRYVNLLLESPDIRLHNYQRVATTVDDEFRGKLINYYN